MIKTKIISSLEKPFIDEKVDKFERLEKISALRGETVRFQIIYDNENGSYDMFTSLLRITPKGALSDFVTVRNLRHMPVDMPYHRELSDDYIRSTPGLYPDLLEPLSNGGRVRYAKDYLATVWVDVEIPASFKAGEYTLSFSIKHDTSDIGVRNEEEYDGEESIKIEVIDAVLPKQSIIFTQWLHCDCLAQYYNIPVWSERHWEIVENFIRTAVKNGINAILTPVFTPPLDTAKGRERLTTQLILIKKTNGRYSFNYKLLDRWIDMCRRLGVEYYEISHLFTQGGATNAPKIMATVDGEYKKIFGWETDSRDEEYKKFLRAFLKSFVAHMKKLGEDKKCLFHISDEPTDKHFENYKNAKKTVSGILKDYRIIDALSDYGFYKKGLVKSPVAMTSAIKPFLENNVPDLFAYTCMHPHVKYSNRFVAFSGQRNRSIGMQMFKYRVKGFLHWGYNFYNNRQSLDPVNPFYDLTADKWVAAGDTFSVYPAPDGSAFESTRICVFTDALQDIRAFRLCSSLYSHEEVVRAIEEELGDTLTFERCARTSDEMLRVRERINKMIKDRI